MATIKERINSISRIAQGDSIVSLNRKEVRELKKERNEQIDEVIDMLQKIDQVLDKKFDGKIVLGNDQEAINWSSMPEDVRNCFLSEFNYQPNDINFEISVNKKSGVSGGILLGFDLDRKGLPWSYVYVGAIKREDARGGTSYIDCQSEQMQPHEAREAMEKLEDKLWGRDKDYRPDSVSFLIHDINQLQLATEMIEYTAGIIEKRLQ